MNRDRRSRLLRSVALLVFCVLVAFIPSSDPLYDESPNDGDETMSLSQAYNTVHLRRPAYGYSADGQPWTPGFAIFPVYFAEYGPVAALVSPLRRIPVARRLSRVLLGASLFFAIATILRRRRDEPVATKQRALAIGAAAGLALLFCSVRSFVFIGTCVRVEASGLFAIALFGFAARYFLEARSERRLALLGAAVVFAIFSGPLAGALCAFDVLALTLFHVFTPFDARKLGRTLVAGVVVITGAALVYVTTLYLVMHGPGGAAQERDRAFASEADLGHARLLHVDPMGILRQVAEFPGILTVLVLIVGGVVLVASSTHRDRDRDASPGFGLLLLRLAMILFGAQFVTAREVYTPLIMTALLVPFVDTITRVHGAFVRRALVVAALPIVTLAGIPNLFARTSEQNAQERMRRELNARRDNHLASLFTFLDREHVASAITTDPLFALLDSDARHVRFLYAANLSGARETDTLRVFADAAGVTYLVTTRFGDEGFVNYLGLQQVRAWTTTHRRGKTDLHYPDGTTVHVEAVFESTAPDIPPGQEYSFGYPFIPSTPFFVYRLERR